MSCSCACAGSATPGCARSDFVQEVLDEIAKQGWLTEVKSLYFYASEELLYQALVYIWDKPIDDESSVHIHTIESLEASTALQALSDALVQARAWAEVNNS
jgi:hypothetical protein